MHRGKGVGIAVAAAFASLAVLAPAAQANHHLMRITEVYPGTGANPDSAYVEMTMYSAGETVTNGQSIRTYNATGAEIHSFAMPGNLAKGNNQSTVLIGDSFPPNAVSADFTDTMLGTNLIAGGGAVCFTSTAFGPIDCVSWGNFTGNAVLPSSAGTPAQAIPDTSGLTRDISAGCPTALEASDDTNNSSADFDLIGFADLDPTPNTVTPTADLCAKPDTKLTKKPKAKTKDRTPTFKFSSTSGGASFQCKLDKGSYKPCTSPSTTKKLKFGKHTFSVRAKNRNGTDPSPANARFEVVKPKRK
jgi:hypothetical protein